MSSSLISVSCPFTTLSLLLLSPSPSHFYPLLSSLCLVYTSPFISSSPPSFTSPSAQISTQILIMFTCLVVCVHTAITNNTLTTPQVSFSTRARLVFPKLSPRHPKGCTFWFMPQTYTADSNNETHHQVLMI